MLTRFDKLTMTFIEPVWSKVEGKDEAQLSIMTFWEAVRFDWHKRSNTRKSK